MFTSTVSKLQSTASVDDLSGYLHQINSTLSRLNPEVYDYYSSDLTQLKQTLVNLEVAHIKHTAISQGLCDFYPTCDCVINKMVFVADIQPHHRILKPTNSVRPTLHDCNGEALA